ncbi:MAG TPA: hypothetical protein VFM99_03640 [Chitinophagales bacterium]|nr:hypothetical protein [Chitinophagales bacterium]
MYIAIIAENQTSQEETMSQTKETLLKVAKKINLERLSGQPFIFWEMYFAEHSQTIYATYGLFPRIIPVTVQDNFVTLRSELKPVIERWSDSAHLFNKSLLREYYSINFKIDHWKNFDLSLFGDQMLLRQNFCRLVFGKRDIQHFISLMKQQSRLSKTNSLKERWRIIQDIHRSTVPKLGMLAWSFSPEGIKEETR